MSIVVDFYGDLACFTNPALKVDRISYPVPTPSAVRGMLASIYNKPLEFYWAVRKIEMMKPIRTMSVKTNEVTCRLNAATLKPIDVDDYRTQRNTVYLKDVRYRITADIVPQKGFESKAGGFVDQVRRRIERGQCFAQPSLGLANCICYFEESDMSLKPISVTRDFGIMVFDTHVPYDNRIGINNFSLSLYHCKMDRGVIHVPRYGSPDVIKLSQMAERSAYAQGIV